MSRTAKPWFLCQTGWWMCYLGGRKIKLAQGRANKQQAIARLAELRFEASKNASPDDPDQTAASVIEAYLLHKKPMLAPATLVLRQRYLQLLAEAHGFRAIPQCKPLHLTRWALDQAGWKSDWMIASAVAVVQQAFKWAVKNRIIA